jgi:ribosomal protein S18 acetylase RimI-like enzyme
MAWMNVRIANAGDYVAVMPMMRHYRAMQEELDASLFALRTDADAEARFRRWIGRTAEDPRAMLLVAEDAGQIVGFLSTMVETDPPIFRCDQYAVVLEFWVDPPHRRKGAGQMLVETAVKELAAMGLRQLRIRTAAGNEPARQMLAACGFRVGTIELVRDVEEEKMRR